MNKILTVIILGLLLSGCATPMPSPKVQKKLIDDKTIILGMDFSELNDLLYNNLWATYPLKRSDDHHHMFAKDYNDIISYGFEKSINGKNILGKDKYTYKLTKIFKNAIERYDYYLNISPIDPKDKLALIQNRNNYLEDIEASKRRAKKEEEENRSEDEKNQIEMASMVERAKETCVVLGFENGTEKFTDCSLKVYTESMQKVAAEAQASAAEANARANKRSADLAQEKAGMEQMEKGLKSLSGECNILMGNC